MGLNTLGITLQDVGASGSFTQGLFYIKCYVLSNLFEFKGVNRFMQLADDSEEVPNSQGKTYLAFKLTQQEWAKLELIRDVLQVSSFNCLFFTFCIN